MTDHPDIPPILRYAMAGDLDGLKPAYKPFDRSHLNLSLRIRDPGQSHEAAVTEAKAKAEAERAFGTIDVQHPETKMTALHYAAELGHTPLAAFLVNQYANPCIEDALGRWPVDIAHATGPAELVDFLENATYGIDSQMVQYLEQTAKD